MIAHDIGREALREEEATRWPAGDWPAKYVVQAPYLATRLWDADEWFAVIMQRDLDEAEQSALKYFNELFPKHGLSKEAIREQLEWMNRAALQFAELNPKTTLQVNYDELAAHPLWVKDRMKFASRQTRL